MRSTWGKSQPSRFNKSRPDFHCLYLQNWEINKPEVLFNRVLRIGTTLPTDAITTSMPILEKPLKQLRHAGHGLMIGGICCANARNIASGGSKKIPRGDALPRTLPWNESQAPDVSNIQPKWKRLWRYVQHFWTTSKLQTLAPYWNKTSRPRGKKPCMLLNACKRETNITLWVVEGFWHLTLFVLRCLEPNQSKVCRVCWTSCKHHDPPSLHPSSESNQIKSLLKSCCVLPQQREFTEPQNHLHTKSVTSFKL